MCFDLDGTLFDDRQYARAGLENAARELLRRTGVDLTEELIEAYFSDGHRKATFDVVLSSAGLADDHVPALVNAYHDTEGPLVPYPDAAGTLDSLGDTYDIGVITGGANGRGKLSRLALDDYVDELIVTADREDSKRDPDPFVELADRFGVAHGSVVVVGDRPPLDFPQPNRLGMTTIRLRRGHYATATASGDAVPDVAVDSLAAARDAVERLDAGAVQPDSCRL
ncbi:HAD family hydrolase [Haloarcula salinisoli]|uniref:HAD family hydrolase n=1 Tax=Haloarcula salinisoli TaxID=2487746 RepID=A0A8J7YKJ2_9EURY|nr:HAD family hydrolase [Halomicroarcula salinisoli]MBX0302888.1 HAD family hydrolase [Halomicroarcula salinisoli]